MSRAALCFVVALGGCAAADEGVVPDKAPLPATVEPSAPAAPTPAAVLASVELRIVGMT